MTFIKNSAQKYSDTFGKTIPTCYDLYAIEYYILGIFGLIHIKIKVLLTKKIQKSAQAHTKHKIPSYMKFKSLKNFYFKNKNSAWYVLLHISIVPLCTNCKQHRPKPERPYTQILSK